MQQSASKAGADVPNQNPPAGFTVSLRNIIDQEQSPVCTAITTLTTVVVHILLIVINTTRYQDWSGLLVFPLTGITLFCGALVNFLFGIVAYTRHEYWGGRIAFFGGTSWLFTMWMVGIFDWFRP